MQQCTEAYTVPMGVNLAAILGRQRPIQKAWLAARTGSTGKGMGRGYGPSPEKNMNFSLEMACFGER